MELSNPKQSSRQLGTGIYEIAIVNIKGCTDSISVLSEPGSVIVDAGPDQEIELGDNTRLQNNYFHLPMEIVLGGLHRKVSGISMIWSLIRYRPGTIIRAFCVDRCRMFDSGQSFNQGYCWRDCIHTQRDDYKRQWGPNNFFNVYGKKAVKP